MFAAPCHCVLLNLCGCTLIKSVQLLYSCCHNRSTGTSCAFVAASEQLLFLKQVVVTCWKQPILLHRGWRAQACLQKRLQVEHRVCGSCRSSRSV